MAKYVDAYVLPIPKANVEAYREFAAGLGKVWREYGALEYVECIGDDVKPGKLTSFPQSVDLKPDETVVFSYIVFESRDQRDRLNALVMKDPRTADADVNSGLFDAKRMFWGGFNLLVEV